MASTSVTFHVTFHYQSKMGMFRVGSMPCRSVHEMLLARICRMTIQPQLGCGSVVAGDCLRRPRRASQRTTT